MTSRGDQFAEDISLWFWRIYDFTERAVVGGVLGWLLTIPALAVIGAFWHDIGLDGYGGDYAWYVTLPLGAIIWSRLRRGRPGGWPSRAAFGFALGFLVGLAASILSGAMGEAMLGVFIVAIPATMVAWPVLVGLLHPKPDRDTLIPKS